MQNIIWDNRANNSHFLRMLIVGAVFVTIYVVLSLTRKDSTFLEILSVIGSFSLWEAADCYFVERPNIQQELLGAAQLLSMEIDFKEN